MTQLKGFRGWGMSVGILVATVMLVSILTLTQTANAATLANHDAVAFATDNSPPTMVVADRDTVGTTATRMSQSQGVVGSVDRPLDGRATRGISSIWILPVALVGVGILARPLLLGRGNSYLAGSAGLQKGNNRRVSAGMKPGLGF